MRGRIGRGIPGSYLLFPISPPEQPDPARSPRPRPAALGALADGVDGKAGQGGDLLGDEEARGGVLPLPTSRYRVRPGIPAFLPSKWLVVMKIIVLSTIR